MRSHIFEDVLQKSGFTKRLHRLGETLMFILLQIGRAFKYISCEMEYIIDSFPVKVCHNIRISRSKLFKGEEYRGYNASKREYFYGLKVQLVTTAQGIPVEMYLVAGREHDSQVLQKMYHDLPPRVPSLGTAGIPTMKLRTCSSKPNRSGYSLAGSQTLNGKTIPQ